MKRRVIALLALSLAAACGCDRDRGPRSSRPPLPSPSSSTATDASSASRGPLSVTIDATEAEVGYATLLDADAGAPSRTITFAVRARVNNDADRVDAQSRFNTLFDEFELVVMDVEGKELRRVPYKNQLSPQAEDSSLTLPPGETRRRLVFPVRWDDSPKLVRLRLDGHFRTPSSDGAPPHLRSNVAEVRIPNY